MLDYDIEIEGGALSFPPSVGYVYAMVNRRAWPGLVKLGCTGSIRSRFNTYQTGDPYRAYRLIAHSDPCADVEQLEKQAHTHFHMARVSSKSEWFEITEAQAIAYLNTLRKQPVVLAGVPHTLEAEEEWYRDDLGVEET